MDMTTTPEIRVMTNWLRSNVAPSTVTDRPSRMNTAEKPATNRPVPLATARRFRRPPAASSVTPIPVVTDR